MYVKYLKAFCARYYHCKKFCRNVILRRQLVVFLSIILKTSLYYTGHLEIKKSLVFMFLTFLAFCNEVILEGRILNISKARLPTLVFHVVLSYELPNILFADYLDPFTTSARFSKSKITINNY